MIFLMMVLAQVTAAADPQISGAWVLELVAKIFGGLAVVVAAVYAGYKKGDADRRTKGSVTIDGQPIEFKKQAPLVTWSDHSSLASRVERLEGHIDKMRDEQAAQYRSLLESGQERENRIKDKIDVVAREWHERIDEFFKGRPGGTRR